MISLEKTIVLPQGNDTFVKQLFLKKLYCILICILNSKIRQQESNFICISSGGTDPVSCKRTGTALKTQGIIISAHFTSGL